MNKLNRGKLLVLSGPSGVGKSTVIGGMRQRHPEMYFSVSATTRPMRDGDAEGVTYLFKTREQFEDMIQNHAFYEYAQYADNYYGTPKAPVDQRLEQGIDVIMDIDVQGALQIKERCSDAVLIFVAAPSFDIIEQRLRGRGDTKESDMVKRLTQAKWEYSQAGKYDYIVINDVATRTVDEIDAILTAEKQRAERMLDVIKLEESL